ncbi:MAG TPA: TetR/AcrR family transcriptional regulator [Vineibacter sp.]|nr:TetR/AcrR family transcriptional regulator [Vineibacter sp.]
MSSQNEFFLDPPSPRLPKRERTRYRLMRAALAVMSARGVAAATAQEVAAVAEVANGSFYNYFPTREALLEALSLWLADSLCRHIAASYAHVEDGAERMAIGNRRYVLFAHDSPDWTRLILGLVDAGASIGQHVWPYARADLRLGVSQGRFRPVNERAAADLISGTVTQAMRRVHAGDAGRSHAIATATTVLRGLGMAYDEAADVARRPLPPMSVALPSLPTGKG